MSHRRCRCCQQVFQPAPFHPQQLVCSQPECQRRRRREYHRRKIRLDPLYAQVVRDSQKKWRDTHPGYPKQYRKDHPQAVERNRRQQHLRDQRGHLQRLVKNNLALDLRHSSAEIWLLGPAADDLVKNNLAASQLLILQPPALCKASCKEQPSGLAPAAGL